MSQMSHKYHVKVCADLTMIETFDVYAESREQAIDIAEEQLWDAVEKNPLGLNIITWDLLDDYIE